MANQQKFTVKVSKELGADERLAMGLEIIDFILERTEKGLDKNNNPFPGYSEGYLKSLDFKLANKGKKPNLKLSGEMLGALEVLDVDKDGEIVIGISANDDFNNEKAEGNILGSYGGDPNRKKARDFMGIKKDDLNKIKQKYSVKTKADREETRNRALELLVSAQIATNLVDALDPDNNGGQ